MQKLRPVYVAHSSDMTFNPHLNMLLCLQVANQDYSARFTYIIRCDFAGCAVYTCGLDKGGLHYCVIHMQYVRRMEEIESHFIYPSLFLTMVP